MYNKGKIEIILKYLLTHLFNKYFLNLFYGISIVQGTRHRREDKSDMRHEHSAVSLKLKRQGRY